MTNALESNPSLKVGSRIEVRIVDMAFGGEGVARVEDFVLFVPLVALGEEVEVEVVEVKKRFARARLVRLVRIELSVPPVQLELDHPAYPLAREYQ